MNRLLALIMLCGALALPALPVHADATDDLLKAVAGGTASEVKAALAAGADIDARMRPPHGPTPLHGAAEASSNPSVIVALIEGGADPGARDGRANTPLHLAVMDKSNPSAWAATIEAESERGSFTEDQVAEIQHGMQYLSRNSNPSVITALIEGGADPNARTKDGFTPLHMAAQHNSNPSVPSVVMALVEGGANPAAIDIDGFTPFDYALENDALRGTDAYWLLSDARFE